MLSLFAVKDKKELSLKQREMLNLYERDLLDKTSRRSRPRPAPIIINVAPPAPPNTPNTAYTPKSV